MFVGVHVEECVCQSADQSFRPGCNDAYGELIGSFNCLPVKAKLVDYGDPGKDSIMR